MNVWNSEKNFLVKFCIIKGICTDPPRFWECQREGVKRIDCAIACSHVIKVMQVVLPAEAAQLTNVHRVGPHVQSVATVQNLGQKI